MTDSRIPLHLHSRIIQTLTDIEIDYDVKILYAVENGSRLTGLSHEDSDCDVRFVFRYNRPIFNTLNGRKMFSSESNPDIKDYKKDTIKVFSEDKMIDVDGWSIDKAIDSLKQSNPSIIEWLFSDIVYVNRDHNGHNFCDDGRKLVSLMHNSNSLYYHYLNMAEKNWSIFIEGKDKVLYKKYLYVLRPMLMIIHIRSENYQLTKPIINDFYELLETVKTQSNHSLNIQLLEEIELLIMYKQTNKTYESDPLPHLNDWIQSFFESERSNSANSTKTKDNLVFQALNSTYEKLGNELKKIRTIASRSEFVNRSDYLSLIGQLTMFAWLVQHPSKHSGEAPQNIMNLINEIEIDSELHDWIKFIVNTKEELESDLDLNKNRSSQSLMFLNHLIEFTSSIKVTSDTELSKSLATTVELVKTGKFARDDFIEFCYRSYLSMIWLTLSTQTARNVPKDIFSDKQTLTVISKEELQTFNEQLSLLKPKYMVKVNLKIHTMIEEFIRMHTEYVNNVCAKYGRKKEIDKQQMYKGSFQSVDCEVFLSLIEKYCL